MHDWLNGLLQDALYAAGTLIAGMIVAAIGQWMHKNGIDMTAQQHDFLTRVVEDGIHFAEEKVANASAGKSEKHDLAVGYVVERTGVSEASASDSIHAALARMGKGATET